MSTFETKLGRFGVKNKVLIVYDDVQTRDYIFQLLAWNQCLFGFAKSYADSFEKLVYHGYDCLILDMDMPQSAATRLLYNLKINNISIPVVGFSRDHQQVRLVECCDAYPARVLMYDKLRLPRIDDVISSINSQILLTRSALGSLQQQ